MKLLTFFARRFVAGETIADAIRVARNLNSRGIKATLDHLGEDCTSKEAAARDRDEVLALLQAIHAAGVDCNVSIKLSQLGMCIDRQFARENLERILEEAKKLRNFIRVDMEGSAHTQMTLDLFYEALKHHSNVGIVIQAMLRRSRSDIEELVRRGARVRLCKGAYKEPHDLAFPDKREVNRSYDDLAALLAKAPVPAFATHDDDRIESAVSAAAKAGLKRDAYEIQMLYGLRSRRWDQLVKEGHSVRVYVPYGTHWFPYFYRRLRERKENIEFVLKNLFR